jgi:hypothetical protein
MIEMAYVSLCVNMCPTQGKAISNLLQCYVDAIVQSMKK